MFHVALVTKSLECGISMAILEGSGVWGLAMCFDLGGLFSINTILGVVAGTIVLL